LHDYCPRCLNDRLLIFVAIWTALALWPARVAGGKEHSFVGYFIFSLSLFPAALIVAYIVDDRFAPAA
jgi:hypothetical protein